MAGLVAAAIGVTLLWSAAVSAAPAVMSVRLGLTGMSTGSNLIGSSTLRAHGGATLGFLAGSVPGLDHLNLDDAVGLRVTMDASQLSGGSPSKVLSTDRPYKVTVRRAGKYPVHWTVELLAGHGKKAPAITHTFFGTVIVDGSTPGRSPNLVGVPTSRPPSAQSGQPSTPASTPSGVPTGPSTAAAQPAYPTPTATLTPDPGTRGRKSGAIAPLPLATSTDTYLFTAFVGTVVLGLLWLLWIASIKPILGR